ncbi:hypothetical protein HNP72_002697 [Sphingobacterium soli]|nr:hypothetical protein [Sphingobacterium soli]
MGMKNKKNIPNPQEILAQMQRTATFGSIKEIS